MYLALFKALYMFSLIYLLNELRIEQTESQKSLINYSRSGF